MLVQDHLFMMMMMMITVYHINLVLKLNFDDFILSRVPKWRCQKYDKLLTTTKSKIKKIYILYPYKIPMYMLYLNVFCFLLFLKKVTDVYWASGHSVSYFKFVRIIVKWKNENITIKLRQKQEKETVDVFKRWLEGLRINIYEDINIILFWITQK